MWQRRRVKKSFVKGEASASEAEADVTSEASMAPSAT